MTEEAVVARVVVFGATGYTGAQVARRCHALGLRPLLAGRHADRLTALADELGGLATGLADASDPASVRALVRAGDVLVSTVGPYLRHGAAALDAAADAGAHYVDVTGEPPFIRRVFDDYGPRAAAAGTTFLTAFGHDWTYGSLAAAQALRDAGESATRVDVAYFDYLPGHLWTGVPRSAASSGTAATLASDMPLDSYAFRDGALVEERLMGRVRSFRVDGRSRQAVSFGGTEQLTVPRLAPGVRDVDVWLGWFGQASRVVSLAVPLSRLPVLGALRGRAADAAAARTGQGPSAEVSARLVCRTAAWAYASDGRVLGRSELLASHDIYATTAGVLAWGAQQLLAGAAIRTGACGAVDAFGLDAVEPAFAELGLRRVV